MSLGTCRFGSFRLLPQARELWRDDEPVTLPPRVFDCMVYLIEHRERAVGRDELIAAVWGRTEVSDTMVAQTVLRIRRTLGDDPSSPQGWIRTVPRFGYRWIAEVESASTERPPSLPHRNGGRMTDNTPDDRLAAHGGRHEHETGKISMADSSAPDVAPRVPGQRGSPPRRTFAMAVFASILVVITIAVIEMTGSPDQVVDVPRRERGSDRPTDPATSAPQAEAQRGWLVLPVANEGDSAPDWVRLGLMDAIAERLRRAGLPVLPSLQTLVVAGEYARAGQPPDIGNLRKSGGSPLILVPQSGRDGDTWRVTLTIHDPDRAPALYRGNGEDPLAAAQVATNTLLSSLGLEGIGAAAAGPREELLARAEASMLAGRLAEAEAIVSRRPADLDDDPLLVLKLAQIRDRQGHGAEAVALVDTILQREDIDPAIRGLALNRIGSTHVRAGRGPEAEAAFRAALDVLPEDRYSDRGESWNGIGIGLHMQGKVEDSTASFARSRTLFTQSGDQLGYARALNNQGLVAMDSGRPHEGLERYLEAEPIMARFGAADEQSNLHQSIAWSRLFLGQYRSADEVARHALRLAQRTENPLVKRQATALALRAALRVGDIARAQRLFATLEQMPVEQHYSLSLYRAMLADAIRDWPQAIESAIDSQDHDDLDREGRGETARILLDAGLAMDDRASTQRSIDTFAGLAGDDEGGRWRHWQALARARVDAVDDNRAAASRLHALWRDTIRLRVAPIEQIEIGLALAGVLLQRGEFGEAQVIADQLSPWLNEDLRVAELDARLAQAVDDDARHQAAMAHVRQLARERPLPDDLD